MAADPDQGQIAYALSPLFHEGGNRNSAVQLFCSIDGRTKFNANDNVADPH